MSVNFQDLNLPAPLQKALAAIKFDTPTPIQAAAIPIALQGKDLIGCAQTGTGKTAAFCIPLVARLLEKPNASALILAPTRELALQISEVLRKLTMPVQQQMKTVLLIGGTDMYRQFRDLKQNPSIIVATPGRLSDHLRRKSVNLSKTEILVLDEGDRMLDMGFEPQIIEILKFMKTERQTMLFSATMPKKVRALAERYLKNPESISVGEQSQPASKITHTIVQTTRGEKNDILLDQLNARQGSVLVFVNTQHGTTRVADYLLEYGFQVTLIHGGRSQGQRNTALTGFRSGKFRVMVATDVAARGLDIPHIAHVINYELPKLSEDYVHRIGRTARAGAVGEAVCLIANEDRGLWNRIARACNLETLPGGRTGGGSGRSFGRGRENSGFRSERPQRSERPRFQSEDRFDGTQRSERPQREERPSFQSKERSGRNTDRPQRSEKPSFRSERPKFNEERRERPQRPARPYDEARPSFETKERFERSEKPKFRSEEAREQRPPRKDSRPKPEGRDYAKKTSQPFWARKRRNDKDRFSARA
jgi:ATP-dependent RNA helicase DeaD